MISWLSASIRRAVPYGLYLVLFGLISWGYVASKNNPASDPTGLWTIFFTGSAIGAFIAFWRFTMAFSPDARFSDRSTDYIEIPDHPDRREFSELLLSHTRQLRRVTLSYEKHRQNLSTIGVTVAIASLAVPIATWTVILFDAFKTREAMPNAWLLVVSSTTSGALGLAISVALLRHLKNNQKPLAEISERLLVCIETGIAVNSSDAPSAMKEKIAALALAAFVKSPSQSARSPESAAEPPDEDRKLLTAGLSILNKAHSNDS